MLKHDFQNIKNQTHKYRINMFQRFIRFIGEGIIEILRLVQRAFNKLGIYKHY